MASTTFLPSIPKLPHMGISKNPKRNRLLIMNANQGENHDQGKAVDENMIVLKMRIKKMKLESISSSISSNKLEAETPSSDWTEWEKRVFTHYHEGVCDYIEMMQSYLMNTRPSVALGVLALVAMCVPLSSSVVAVNALKVAKGLLAGCHVCIDIDF